MDQPQKPEPRRFEKVLRDLQGKDTPEAVAAVMVQHGVELNFGRHDVHRTLGAQKPEGAK